MVNRVHRHFAGEDDHDNPAFKERLFPEGEVRTFAETMIGAYPIRPSEDDAIKLGDVARVEDGAFATFPGTVKPIDEGTGDLMVDVAICGGLTSVSLHPEQVSRLDAKKAA